MGDAMTHQDPELLASARLHRSSGENPNPHLLRPPYTGPTLLCLPRSPPKERSLMNSTVTPLSFFEVTI